MEPRNPTLLRTSPVSLTMREKRADNTGTGLEEITHDRASARHKRIKGLDFRIPIRTDGPPTYPPLPLLRATRSSQAATPTQKPRSSMRAPLMCSLAYHTCSILRGGAKGRGLNPRPITIHPSLSPGSRPRREPSLAPTRRPGIIIRNLPLTLSPLSLSLSLSLPERSNHLDRLFVYQTAQSNHNPFRRHIFSILPPYWPVASPITEI